MNFPAIAFLLCSLPFRSTMCPHHYLHPYAQEGMSRSSVVRTGNLRRSRQLRAKRLGIRCRYCQGKAEGCLGYSFTAGGVCTRQSSFWDVQFCAHIGFLSCSGERMFQEHPLCLIYLHGCMHSLQGDRDFWFRRCVRVFYVTMARWRKRGRSGVMLSSRGSILILIFFIGWLQA